MKYTPVNWNIWQANPLNYVGHSQLVTPAGLEVTIEKPSLDFFVTIGERRVKTGGNMATCAYLNRYEVGLKTL